MAANLDQYRDLLAEPIVAGLATVLPNGQPQVTPVWFDYDGTYIRVNTSTDRQKYRDLRDRPQATLLVLDPKNAYRWVEIRGRLVGFDEEGADAHIDLLAKRYLGADSYPFRNPAETRVICSIEPEKAVGQL